MTTENNAPAAPDENDFDAMFEQAALDAEKGVVSPAGGPPADPPADPPAKEPVTPPADPPADPPAKEPVTPPADPPVDPPANPPAKEPVAPPKETPAPPVTPPAPPKETPEQIAAREALEASIKPYEPSEAEKTALAQFAKDFPNEYAAVEARLKSVDKDMNARIYNAVQDVLKTVAPRLASVEATTSQSEMERHVTALHTAHPDYDVVIAKVPDWIKTQPAYIRPALQQVYDQGSTQDVIAMVADYKKATGAPAPAAPRQTPPGPPSDAADLTPVVSKRTVTSPRGAADPKDYDGAWAELSASMK